MSHAEFVLVRSILYSEWAHRFAIRLVKLLWISLQMDLDSNDAETRTMNIRIRIISQQCYVAVNTIQALAVGDGPAVIFAVSDL
jgi:hypothetical protein